MYRQCLRTRGVLCYFLCYLISVFTLFLISEDTLDHPDHVLYDANHVRTITLRESRFELVTNTNLAKAGQPIKAEDSQHVAMGILAQREGEQSSMDRNDSRVVRTHKDAIEEARLTRKPGQIENARLQLSSHDVPLNKVVDTSNKTLNGKRKQDLVNLRAKGKEWIPPSNFGEQGQPAEVNRSQLNYKQKREFNQGYKLHRFDQFVSDRISLHRSVPAVLDQGCKDIQYNVQTLPTTTVVIIFHNEAWSTLLRTVHSVLDRSPGHLLQRIILVDDFSDMPHLHRPLQVHLSQAQFSKVTLLRSPSRQGLIKARLLGFYHANTTTVVFLDSHCECFENWLEPLLDRVAKNPSTVTVPVIEVIDLKTFKISSTLAKDVQVGTFNWNLLFEWMLIQPHEKLRRTSDIQPIRSPTMAGGLFAINREFFHKLGTYDPGMKIWGGENLELSFKIWMCGGTLEIVPCSHVAHVFRINTPIKPGNFKNFLAFNLGRLAEVWLDEYKNLSYASRHVTRHTVLQTIGDVTERKALRRRLQCHTFGWFMKHIMPEVYFPADRTAHGLIKNEATGLCIQQVYFTVLLNNCTNGIITRTSTWYMVPDPSPIYQETEDPRENRCLDYSGKETVDFFPCYGQGGNQLWKYVTRTKQLYHVRSQKCLKVGGEGHGQGFRKVEMVSCEDSDPWQQWMRDSNPVEGPSWRKDEAAGKLVL